MIITWTSGNKQQPQWITYGNGSTVQTVSTGDSGALPVVTKRRQRMIAALMNKFKRRGPRIRAGR